MTTIILTILFALIVVINAVVGLVRGLNKSLIRLVTLVLAVVFTFVLAGPMTTMIADSVQIEGMTLGQTVIAALRGEEMIAGFLDAAPLLQDAILAAPAFVLSIVMFPVVFFVLKFISWILFLCVQKPLRRLIFKDTGNREEEAAKPVAVRVGKRFAGLGLGIVTGVLVFGMVVTPVLGLFRMLPETDTLDSLLDTMVDQGILTEDSATMVQDAFGVTDNALVNFYAFFGADSVGQSFINSVSGIDVEGSLLYLSDEFDALLSVVQTALDGGVLDALMASGEDPTALYSLLSDNTFMDALMQDMFRSRLLCSVVPEIMGIAMESIATSMEMPANKEAVYNNMMNDIALAVQNADVDYAAIEAYEQANGVSYSLSLLSSTGRTRDGGIMTEEEYEAEIQKLIDLSVTISAILNQSIAEDNTAFTDSIAAHIVNEVRSAGGAENYNADSVKNAISGISSSDVDAGAGDADALLGQLTDPERFETNVTTADAIGQAIRETVSQAVADETQAAETASTLANVVSNFAGAVSSATNENGELDVTNLDFGLIADAVTTLQNSTLKDVGSTVLDIVASSELGSNDMVSGILDAVKEGYESGEDISGTIGTAGALIGLGSAMGGGGEVDEEILVNSITGLIDNLDPFTISLLPNILTTETIVSMGVPEEYAQATYSVVETLLQELMALQGTGDYESEVDAILSLYELVTSDLESFTEEDIPELVNYAIESDAIFNTLVSISTSNPFGLEIPEDIRPELIAAIEEYYGQSGQTDRERDIYMAVATFLGLDGEVALP